MSVKKYRAKSMQEALALVRRELGPQACVLRTREVRGGIIPWLGGSRVIEVLASSSVMVPSRLPAARSNALAASAPKPQLATASFGGLAARPRRHKAEKPPVLAAPKRLTIADNHDDALFKLFAGLIDVDVHEELARSWVDRAKRLCEDERTLDVELLKAHLARSLAAEMAVSGPIRVLPAARRLVALVGPTGVGKTTTIAKLAANFRLREKRRVGLITVDTYRIAAVEQLRTYADIIDLPLEVVATPQEMRQALSRMADLEIVLMDTAGRSPRDEVKLQELKSLLAEAGPDEVHLVLSSVAGSSTLLRTAEQFKTVGTTALLLTKLDEATSLGNLWPLVRDGGLPLSYFTHGQSVPDDIAPADAARLANAVLGLQPIAK